MRYDPCPHLPDRHAAGARSPQQHRADIAAPPAADPRSPKYRLTAVRTVTGYAAASCWCGTRRVCAERAGTAPTPAGSAASSGTTGRVPAAPGRRPAQRQGRSSRCAAHGRLASAPRCGPASPSRRRGRSSAGTPCPAAARRRRSTTHRPGPVPRRAIGREVVLREHTQCETVTAVERQPEDPPTTHVLVVGPRESAALLGQRGQLRGGVCSPGRHDLAQ
jgi:hypothetical protein